MKKFFLGVAVTALAIAIYLNFAWNGPSDTIDFVRWKAADSPSWIEWVFDKSN